MDSRNGPQFWREALTLQGSITPHVLADVVICGLLATILCLVSGPAEGVFGRRLALEVAPWEVGGAILGLLLVLRTNAGYDRWWEARKLWGGIVNQSRNLVIGALAYGPPDPKWREKLVSWAAALPHVARASLRDQPPPPAVADLVGPKDADRIAAASHMPSFVALQICELLREVCDRREMESFAFLQVDRERALLIDHIGACERILKTPLPRVYSINIRRFIALFLFTLPLALLHRLEGEWLVPLITMLVAYLLLSLDRIGIELENPFSTKSHSHLPLDEISATIERQVKGLLGSSEPEA
jgi:putative membrane protein